MFNRSQLQGMILLCASFLASFAAQGETAWVSDQFEITLRTGPSSDNAIQLVIDSGTQLDVLEIDAESALRAALHRFRSRFGHIEERLGPAPRASLDEMEALWQEAKGRETRDHDVGP